MKLTEQEARTKVCPIAGQRAAADQQVKGRCLASTCMLWRWRQNNEPSFIEARYVKPADRPEPRGYCGLSN